MIEMRGNNSVYFYRSERDGDLVRRVYVARGEVALALARRDAIEREGLREEREAEAAERAELDRLDALVAGWCGRVEALFVGVMSAAGCHRHRRQWRKRRMNAQEH